MLVIEISCVVDAQLNNYPPENNNKTRSSFLFLLLDERGTCML